MLTSAAGKKRLVYIIQKPRGGRLEARCKGSVGYKIEIACHVSARSGRFAPSYRQIKLTLPLVYCMVLQRNIAVKKIRIFYSMTYKAGFHRTNVRKTGK